MTREERVQKYITDVIKLAEEGDITTIDVLGSLAFIQGTYIQRMYTLGLEELEKNEEGVDSED